MKYDIEPQAALGTIASSAVQASGYARRVESLVSAFSSLGAALPNSQVTSAALSGYQQGPVTTGVESIVARTQGAILGGQAAVKAYQAGDEQMVESAVSAAFSAPSAAGMPGVSGVR